MIYALLARAGDIPGIVGYLVLTALAVWITWKFAKFVTWARSKLAR